MAYHSSPHASIKRHQKYYFEDGNAVFLVETTLFRLHRSFLCRDEASIFSSMFACPNPAADFTGVVAREGTADEHPIYVPDERADDFALLMRAIIADAAHVLTLAAFDFEQWKILFRLADKFCLESLIHSFKVAIEEETDGFRDPKRLALSSLFPSAFQDDNEFSDTLFRNFIERDDPINDEEANIFGAKLCASIGRWREALLDRKHKRCHHGETYVTLPSGKCFGEEPYWVDWDLDF